MISVHAYHDFLLFSDENKISFPRIALAFSECKYRMVSAHKTYLILSKWNLNRIIAVRSDSVFIQINKNY